MSRAKLMRHFRGTILKLYVCHRCGKDLLDEKEYVSVPVKGQRNVYLCVGCALRAGFIVANRIENK